MGKLFEVEFIVRAVVAADDINDAWHVARRERSDIVRDSDLECDVVCEIKSAKNLPDGWDEGCLPFGTRDDMPIRAYFDSQQPERDTKTIDIFSTLKGSNDE